MKVLSVVKNGFKQDLAPVVVPPPSSPKLSSPNKLRRLVKELGVWKKAGFPVASKKTRQDRATVCDGCEHWRAAGNGGLGECMAPGCGCTRAKRWLATSKCPLGKWPE